MDSERSCLASDAHRPGYDLSARWNLQGAGKSRGRSEGKREEEEKKIPHSSAPASEIYDHGHRLSLLEIYLSFFKLFWKILIPD